MRHLLLLSAALSLMTYGCDFGNSGGSSRCDRGFIGEDCDLCPSLTCMAECEEMGEDSCWPNRQLFKDLRVVSAVPATLDPQTSQWVRSCKDESGEGIIVNVAMTSTSGIDDTDTSIRPGDLVNLRVVNGGNTYEDYSEGAKDIEVTHNSVLLDLDCVDAIPDGSLSSCGSLVGVAMNSPHVSYEAYATIDASANLADQRDAARTTPHNVMLLIDQSGSMGGLVNLSTEPIGATACIENDDCEGVGGGQPHGLLQPRVCLHPVYLR